MIKGRKLEKYLTVILFFGLAILVIWKFDIIGLLIQRKEREEIEKNIEIWMKNAKENLKENFLVMEGKNHFFIRGNLVSKCTELDSDSHCPVSLFEAKINSNRSNLLFMDGFQFAIATLDVYPYPINEGINVLGFLEKNHNDSISLEFGILDYVPNTTLCKTPHDKQNLCTIKWTKKISLGGPILAEALSVKVLDFDYSFLEKELKISLRGEAKSSEAPSIFLGIYRDSGLKKSLTREKNLELQDNNGVYGFELNESFNISDSEADYSILLLITKKNSFQAMEWILKNGELVNTIIYE